MENSGIKDPLFLQAVTAIDTGDRDALQALLDAHPELVRKRLPVPAEGYFRQPYLLWFVADNPIRNERLPANIADITRMLIAAVQKNARETLSFQLDYTLGLVATGRTPKTSGVQAALIDLLIDAGAKPGRVLGAIAQGNPEAAAHILGRGGELTFATAVGLDWRDEIDRMAGQASPAEWQLALIVAAFLGNAERIAWLIRNHAPVNGIPEDCDGFHGHATALHQAVSSGSLESVKLLVEAGADLNATDRMYQGTPLDWAIYLQKDEGTDTAARKKYADIEAFLHGYL